MSSRTDNAVDFWRGIALIMIFINHVPGNVYSNYTLHRMAFCDAADLFVFLAGWSLSYATGGPLTPAPANRVIMRLFARAIELYRAQLVLTALALAILAATSLLRNNPLFLEWHNAGPAFYDPVRTTVGWVMLTHQLWFFDILPLYVVLLLQAPLFIIIARWNRMAGFAASLALYVATLTYNWQLPSWPGEQGWFFNPFAWQFTLMLGFLAAEATNDNRWFCDAMKWSAPGAAVITAMFAVATMRGFDIDPFSVPEPRFFFLIDKTYASPSRIVNLLALVIAFSAVFAWAERYLGWIGGWICGLGRNSLAVFAIASLLSLLGQLLRFIVGGGLTIDTFTLLCGLVGMGGTAWFVEWRTRSPNSPSRPS